MAVHKKQGSGERFIVDITRIKKPTLAAKGTLEKGTVDLLWNGEGLAEESTPQSIPQNGGGAQGQIRPSIKKRDEVYDEVLKAVRAGGQRVAAGKSV